MSSWTKGKCKMTQGFGIQQDYKKTGSGCIWIFMIICATLLVIGVLAFIQGCTTTRQWQCTEHGKECKFIEGDDKGSSYADEDSSESGRKVMSPSIGELGQECHFVEVPKEDVPIDMDGTILE